MKFALGLVAALAFTALGAIATPSVGHAQSGGSTMETGSNASGEMKGGSSKMSGSKAKSKKMKKKSM